MEGQSVYIGRSFCIQQRACVLIVGIISLVEGINEIILGSLMCQYVTCDYQNNNYNYSISTYYYDICTAEIPVGCGSYGPEWYSISAIVQGSINLLCSLLLLVGVSTMAPNMALPYLILMSFAVPAYLAEALTMFVSSTYNQYLFGTWFVIWGVILCYFIYVVYCYRKLMIQQLNSPQRMTSAYPPGMQVIGGFAPPMVVVNPYQTAAAGVYHTPASGGPAVGYYSTPGSYSVPGALSSPSSYPPPYTYGAPASIPAPGTGSPPGY